MPDLVRCAPYHYGAAEHAAVPVGEKATLPAAVAKAAFNFRGWFDAEGNKVDMYNFTPAANGKLTATFGSEVVLNYADDEVDPVLNPVENATVVL